MEEYFASAASGVNIGGWLVKEGTIGDERRSWDLGKWKG